jgi:hypothetical protein
MILNFDSPTENWVTQQQGICRALKRSKAGLAMFVLFKVATMEKCGCDLNQFSF